MENIKWPKEATNEENDFNNILRRKANLIGHILSINCLLHDGTEGQMAELKGVGRRTQLLHDLRNRRRYWELMDEV